MKFLYNFFLLFFLMISHSHCQNKKIGLVVYGHIESPGMGEPIGKDLNSFLIFDKSKSYYVTAKDSLELKKNSESIFSTKKEKGVVGGISPTSVQGNQVYFDKSKNQLWWNKLEGTHKYVQEKNINFNWTVTNETKKIGNFTCNKAKIFFRGRNYTVWFTKEIPASFGPWKFNGLPGLILEAYDTDKELYIYFKSLQYPTNKFNRVNFIKKGNEYEKIDWLTINDFSNFRKETIQKANTKSKMLAKKYNWPTNDEEVKMVDIYIESFD